MLNPLFSLCVYVAEMLISYMFFSSLLESKFNTAKILFIGGGLFALGSFVNILFQNNGVINTIATWAINMLFAYCCFKASLSKCMFYSTILWIINTAIEVSAVSIISSLAGDTFLSYNNNIVLLFSEAITIKTLYFLAALFLTSILNSSDNRNTVPLDFIVYPVSTAVCQSIFWHICAQPNTSSSTQKLLSILSICLFISTIFLFFAYSHQVKKERQTMQIQSELNRLQTEQSYYQILEQQNQQLKI